MIKLHGLNVLEKNDFEKYCPSFNAIEAKSDVSKKYAFLSTHEISMQLWDLGWMPVYARESRTIDPTNRGFTSHMVRWAHKDHTLEGERVELVGRNSHNRASAFTFMAGVFRLICSNGLISQTSDLGSFKIKHMGDIQQQVCEAVNGISTVAAGIGTTIQQFKDIELSPDEQGIFAQTAHSFIYEKDPRTAPIKAAQLLHPRRGHDSLGGGFNRFGSRILPKPNLWTTFNVVQENTMKGGLKGFNTTGKRTKTRKIKSIDKDIKLNSALWAMAEKMSELKAS